MSTHESLIGMQWLTTTLGGDSALSGYAPGGVHRGMASPGTATPYVLLALQAAADTTTLSAFRVKTSCVYQVKAVGPASQMSSIAQAASRIDALIGSPPKSGATSDGLILASYRESGLLMDELVSGEMWSNVGGLYRLEVQQTS